MSIIRRRHNGKFTVIGNAPMDDTRLGEGALGVLCYLRSRPDNWNVIPEQLCQRFGCGRSKMYGILRTLVEAGYIVRRQFRDLETMTFGRIEYIVFDEPEAELADEPCAENRDAAFEPRAGNPDTAEPHTAEPHTENRHALIKTDSHQRLKGTKTDRHQRLARGRIGEEVYNYRSGGLS